PHSHIQYTRNFHHHEVHRQDLTLTRHTTTDRDTTGLARVWYQITDPTGRQLHPPPGGPPPPAGPPAAGAPAAGAPAAEPRETPGPPRPPAQDQFDLGENADSLVA
ncbi:MAG: hypothetical protein ACOH2F_15415, partial [Cellulomonas sp.]